MDPNDPSAIFPDCKLSTDKQTMTCNIVQVWARPKMSPEKAKEEVERNIRETARELDKSGARSLAKDCKDGWWKQANEVYRKQLSQDTGTSPRIVGFLRGLAERVTALCDQPSVAALREVLRYTFEKETRTCRIYGNPWQETLKRGLGNRWVSNRGPGGICGVVVVSTFESKPTNPTRPDSLHVWTYETQKIVTNKEMGGPLCPLDGKSVYSWQALDFDVNCEFIEFGF